MSRYSLRRYPEGHSPFLSPVYISVGGFGEDRKFRADTVLIDNVLSAQAVAVLFVNASCNCRSSDRPVDPVLSLPLLHIPW